MLELPLVKGDPFHHVLEAILDLSDVAHIVCTKRGLDLQAVDTKEAAIVALLLPAKDFKGYTCDDEYISMGIPIDELVKAIRCGHDEDTITFKVGEENLETITLSFVSPEKSAVDYELRLVDARFPLLDWQGLGSNYQGSVKMSSVEFSRICKYLSTFGEGDGVISVTKEELTFHAKGPIGHLYMEYTQAEPDTTTFYIDMQEPVSLTLDLKYLNTFAKVFTLSGQGNGQVKLSFSKTFPLLVECKIGQKGWIRCFVAQKVKEFQGEEEEKEAQKEKGESEPQGEEDTDANKKTERKHTHAKKKKKRKHTHAKKKKKGEHKIDEGTDANKKKKRKLKTGGLRQPKTCSV